MSWGTFKLYLYTNKYKSICIYTKEYVSYRKSCAYIYAKLFTSRWIFIFLLFLMFCLGSLENIDLVLLIRLSYKKRRVNSTFNADRNTFLENKTMMLVSGLYMLIGARNKISKLFIAFWKIWKERDVSLLEVKSCNCYPIT